MGAANKLKFEDLLEAWEEKLNQSYAFSPSDIQELKSHLLDQTDELIEKGLSKKKAFLIATKMVGQPAILRDEYEQANQAYIQTQKTLMVTAGAIVYYCFNYFALFIAKLIVIIGKKINVENADLLLLNKIVLGFPLLIMCVFFISLFINDNYILKAINEIQIRPKQAVIIVILTFFFVVGDRCTLPFLNGSLTDQYWKNQFFEVYVYFEYSFLILVLIGFILIFLKYFRNSTSPA